MAINRKKQAARRRAAAGVQVNVRNIMRQGMRSLMSDMRAGKRVSAADRARAAGRGGKRRVGRKVFNTSTARGMKQFLAAGGGSQG